MDFLDSFCDSVETVAYSTTLFKQIDHGEAFDEEKIYKPGTKQQCCNSNSLVLRGGTVSSVV